jgi:hypothetical protein
LTRGWITSKGGFKADSIPEHEEYYIGPVPEKISPMKEKTDHSHKLGHNDADPRERETDG